LLRETALGAPTNSFLRRDLRAAHTAAAVASDTAALTMMDASATRISRCPKACSMPHCRTATASSAGWDLEAALCTSTQLSISPLVSKGRRQPAPGRTQHTAHSTQHTAPPHGSHRISIYLYRYTNIICYPRDPLRVGGWAVGARSYHGTTVGARVMQLAWRLARTMVGVCHWLSIHSSLITIQSD
jgi:hypothetical protein